MKAHRPAPRLRSLTIAAVMALGAAGHAQAQSLVDLFEAARTFDATYLAARALAESAEFRAAQKELREKRLQKQQLEAQAQKTDRSKCAERKNGNG